MFPRVVCREFSLGLTNSACVLVVAVTVCIFIRKESDSVDRRRGAPSRLLSAYGHLAAYLLLRVFRQQNNMFQVDNFCSRYNKHVRLFAHLTSMCLRFLS